MEKNDFLEFHFYLFLHSNMCRHIIIFDLPEINLPTDNEINNNKNLANRHGNDCHYISHLMRRNR